MSTTTTTTTTQSQPQLKGWVTIDVSYRVWYDWAGCWLSEDDLYDYIEYDDDDE